MNYRCDAFVEQLKETFKEENPVANKTKSCPIQLGKTRRKSGKEYIHTRNAKSTNKNGPFIK